MLELFEAPEIEQIITKIEKLGLDITTYASGAVVNKDMAVKDAEKKIKPTYTDYK